MGKLVVVVDWPTLRAKRFRVPQGYRVYAWEQCAFRLVRKAKVVG